MIVILSKIEAVFFFMPSTYLKAWNLQINPLCILSKTYHLCGSHTSPIHRFPFFHLVYEQRGNLLDSENCRHENYITLLLFRLSIFLCPSSFQRNIWNFLLDRKKRLSLGHTSFKATQICNVDSFNQLFFFFALFFDNYLRKYP